MNLTHLHTPIAIPNACTPGQHLLTGHNDARHIPPVSGHSRIVATRLSCCPAGRPQLLPLECETTSGPHLGPLRNTPCATPSRSQSLHRKIPTLARVHPQGYETKTKTPGWTLSSLIFLSLIFTLPTAVKALQVAGLGDFATPNKSDTDTTTDPSTSEAPEIAPKSFWERDTLTGNWNGLRETLEAAGVAFGLQEQSEVWGILTGGLRRGAVYDGLTTGSITLDLGKLMDWTGATFFVDAYQIHGHGPTANLVGNMQIVSNIEATRDTKLYQLWLEQHLLGGRLTIRIGQEGANDQMMITQYSALFLNSSFGFPGLPAADLPSGGPNYPMATPFCTSAIPGD